jgi:BirA family biotin operon repressor/biotin-[acetyl-CoA-carboxylase] ligase
MFPASDIKFHIFKEIDSTQSEAWRRATPETSMGWTAIAADWQTLGRGQRGAVWQNGREKQLALSVLSPVLQWESDRIAVAQAAVALAVLQALQKAGAHWPLWEPVARSDGQPYLGLKWPNDVVLGGYKWGGILVEAQWQEARLHRMVVGIGLTLEGVPAEVPHATDWASWGSVPGVQRVREAVATAVVQALDRVSKEAPDAEWNRMVPQYEAVLWGLGSSQRFFSKLDPALQWEGVPQGVTPDGRLRVRGPQGEVLLHQGEWAWTYPLWPTASGPQR